MLTHNDVCLHSYAVVSVGAEQLFIFVSEATPSAEVCVTLVGMIEREVVVELATQSGSAQGELLLRLACHNTGK